MIVSYPRPREITAIGQASGLEYPDTIRDIVRLVAIAHLTEQGFLDEDSVLVGGMALRLRGSNRFTVFDTDSSVRKPPAEEKQIRDGLDFSDDELEIEPADPTYWTSSKKLVTAQPVTYKAFFAGGASDPHVGEFSLTVNERGLNMPAEWLELQTPYPSLIFAPAPSVPVMHLIEQTAEKILGWCGNSLMKHYVDLGWIAKNLHHELDGPALREQCDKKLKMNQTLFEDFRRFDGVNDLIEPLRRPDDYFGPLNRNRDRRDASVQFLGDRLSPLDAKRHVQERLVPLLED